MDILHVNSDLLSGPTIRITEPFFVCIWEWETKVSKIQILHPIWMLNAYEDGGCIPWPFGKKDTISCLLWSSYADSVYQPVY